MVHVAVAIVLSVGLVQASLRHPPSRPRTIASSYGTLPACSAAHRPCQCPHETFYSSATTYGFFPVAVKYVEDITAVSFLDLSYIGLNTTDTTGQGLDIGSSRTFSLDWDAALSPVAVTEVLTGYSKFTQGQGYSMTWEMGNTPYYYERLEGQSGMVGGFWSFEEARSLGDTTFLVWTTWSCFSDLFDFKVFHELSFQSIAQILQDQGKSDGSIADLTSF